MNQTNTKPARYVLQFRNGVWQIWDRHQARVVQAFGLFDAAVKHHAKFANGAALEFSPEALAAERLLQGERDLMARIRPARNLTAKGSA